MSKVKSPQDKKKLSLDRDRRNLYGECPTSSRRNIRRGKQRSQRELRRATSQELASLRGAADDLAADEVGSRAKSKILLAKRAAFKKRPDRPLGEAIKWKARWRARRSGTPLAPNV
jgi:hypothetical protein